jgi:hypothetical protein
MTFTSSKSTAKDKIFSKEKMGLNHFNYLKLMISSDTQTTVLEILKKYFK